MLFQWWRMHSANRFADQLLGRNRRFRNLKRIVKQAKSVLELRLVECFIGNDFKQRICLRNPVANSNELSDPDTQIKFITELFASPAQFNNSEANFSGVDRRQKTCSWRIEWVGMIDLITEIASPPALESFDSTL